MPETQDSLEISSRRFLTFLVVTISVVGVVALGITAIAFPGNDRFERLKFVAATILPIIASWVGTIMAFYFSKENFMAATQSVTELTKTITGMDKLKSIPVQDKMRPRDKITFEVVKPGEEDNKKLTDLLTKYSSLERIVILQDNFVMRYLIYRAMITEFLSKVATGTVNLSQGKTAKDLTLKDLLDSDPKTKTFFEKSFGFVPLNATLAEAKAVMDKIERCGDVFVTQSGKENEPILGWITDNTIAENSKV